MLNCLIVELFNWEQRAKSKEQRKKTI